MYRLVIISIDLSETAHFAHWISETMSETIFSNKIFFSRQTFFFLTKNSFSWILSQTEFISDWVLSRITYRSCILYAII